MVWCLFLFRYPLVNKHSHGKSPFLLAMFNSYFRLTEGNMCTLCVKQVLIEQFVTGLMSMLTLHTYDFTSRPRSRRNLYWETILEKLWTCKALCCIHPPPQCLLQMVDTNHPGLCLFMPVLPTWFVMISVIQTTNLLQFIAIAI